jgi:hypothetical protein
MGQEVREEEGHAVDGADAAAAACRTYLLVRMALLVPSNVAYHVET